MKGLIVVNAYDKNEGYLYQPKRLKEELTSLGVRTDVKKSDGFLLTVEGGNVLSKVEGYDFCVFWDKDKYLLSMLEKAGLPTFNKKDAILTCDDKMATCIALAGGGVPMPRTFAGTLCYRKDEPVSSLTLDDAEKLGYPLVVKECYGSLGESVCLVNDRKTLERVAEKVKCKPHLYQEYIATSYGKDVRVIVVGDKVVGAMLRRGKDFRSNVGAGGKGEPYPLTCEIEKLALKIAKILGLDYCGIDLLFGKDGFIVCEVNSNAFFFEFERVTGINVAREYAEYIVKKISAACAAR